MSVSQNFPEVRPSLNLNFVRSKTLDPKVTFTRASTGTYVGADGRIKTATVDEARFDHDPETGESLGLLIEESRSNIIPTSQNIPQTFVISGLTYAQQTTSPDGTQNAYVFVPDGGGSYHYMYWYYSVVNGTTYTVSFYAKRMTENSQTTVYSYPIFTGGQTVVFNLSTGVASQSSYSKDMKYVGNGWWRCWYTFTHTGATGSEPLHYFPGSPGTYTGDQTNGIATWGFQVEQGSFPTSYIPTSGASVTRSKDDALITGESFESWINKNEGTWLIDFRNLGVSPSLLSISGTGGSVNERYMMWNIGTDGEVSAAVADGGVLQTNESISFTPGQTTQFTKAIFAVKDNDFAITVNGLPPVTDTSGTVYNSPTQLRFAYGNGANTPNAHFKTCIYYPERLTNTQLQNLTK